MKKIIIAFFISCLFMESLYADMAIGSLGKKSPTFCEIRDQERYDTCIKNCKRLPNYCRGDCLEAQCYIKENISLNSFELLEISFIFILVGGFCLSLYFLLRNKKG